MFKVDAKAPVSISDSQREVVTAMAEFLTRRAIGIVRLSLDHSLVDAMPFCWRGFRVTPRYTYQIDLLRSAEDIIRRFSSRRRNDIAKAKRDGLTVHRVQDPCDVAKLVSDTMRFNRAQLSARVLDNILYASDRESMSYGFVTKSQDRAIACTFVVHDRNTAYYLLGGYDRTARHHGAGALAIVESILEAQRRGLAVFDFEGSMIPDVERFFRGFGGRLAFCLTVTRAWFPLECLLKFRYRNLF